MMEKIDELTIQDLKTRMHQLVPAFQYECELIRRMTLEKPCALAREAQRFFHDDFSIGIVKVLASKYYLEDFVKAKRDYHSYYDDVKGQFDFFVVKPDPVTGEKYGILIKYKKGEIQESSKLSRYVLSCSVRHFINLYKYRKRRGGVNLCATDEMIEAANNRSQEEDARIMLYRFICPDDSMSNEEVLIFGNDLLQKVIGFLPQKEQEVVQLTFFKGYNGLDAYNLICPEKAGDDEDPVVRKNKQDYISHLRARAIEHMKQIKKKLYGE